jgi:hypothetical protein
MLHPNIDSPVVASVIYPLTVKFFCADVCKVKPRQAVSIIDNLRIRATFTDIRSLNDKGKNGCAEAGIKVALSKEKNS